MSKKEIANTDNSKLNKIIDQRKESEIMKLDTIEKTRQKVANNISWWKQPSRELEISSEQEIIQEANRLIKQYWLSPLWNRTDFSYLSRVISISDFQANPDKYFLKLTKWFGSFPLDFALDLPMRELLSQYAGIYEWMLDFQQWVVFRNKNLGDKISKALRDIWINTAGTQPYIRIDFLNFLKNYDAFVSICENEFESGLENEIESNSENESEPGSENEFDIQKEKQIALNQLKLMKHICISIFNTVTSIKILDPKNFFETRNLNQSEAFELQKNNLKEIDEQNPYAPNNKNEQETFWWIEQMLLQTANGTSQEDINKLLPIQNLEEFNHIVDFLIWKIKTDKKLKKSWIAKLDKDIEEFTTQEMIALAAYLARYLIDDYENLESWVERVLKWFSCDGINGKCSDYTWMALQIIKNYLMVEYPEKFENIYIWYDTQNIWDNYKHCYMKIYAYDEDGKIKTTFLDPTKLANHRMEKLTLTRNIIKNMEAWNFPIQIDRNAEDIIISKLRQFGSKKKKLQSNFIKSLEFQNISSIFSWMVEKIKEKLSIK